MKFTVLDNHYVYYTPNTYIVRCEVMSGDADLYENFDMVNFRPCQDEHLIEDLAKIYDEMLATFPRGRSGRIEDSYTKIPGWNKWFVTHAYDGSEDTSDTTVSKQDVLNYYRRVFNEQRELSQESLYKVEDTWPFDKTCLDFTDGHMEASIRKWEVFYVDEYNRLFPTTTEL